MTSTYLKEACAIGDRLVKAAVFYRDTCNWVGRQVPEMTDRANPQPKAFNLGPNFYDGSTGPAVLLMQLYHTTREQRYRTTAAAALRHAGREARRRFFSDEADPQLQPVRFGFYSGAVGTAWALDQASRILEDDALGQTATALLDLLANHRDENTIFDVVGGNAGAIPALLEMDRHDRPHAGALAEHLANDLIQRAIPEGDGVGWHGTGNWYKNLLGFSHGASGAGWALATMYRHTGEERYAEFARAAFQYERDHFAEAQANWPDFREGPDEEGVQRCVTMWCHGAPGISLSRALSHSILGDQDLLGEARLGHTTTRRFLRTMLEQPGWNWMLCHGVGGNAAIYQVVGDLLGDDGALATARRVGTYGIERYGEAAQEQSGNSFTTWPLGHPGNVELSMMVGLTGVGQFLLGLHDPSMAATALVPGRTLG